ncbi:MAG: amidohydrolase family protein [Saprospiraceae bacterium]|nr:amidohydrolase family protein [Candidatus Opimibacter skivensis]
MKLKSFYLLLGVLVIQLVTSCQTLAQPGNTTNDRGGYLFNDAHFHLTNYVQEGISIQDYLKIMGDKVGRSTLFGIPVQQQWSYRVTGDFAPTYYLDSDAPLYYYSFTDAYIAMTYKSLSKSDQARFDPMITGFNPTDMYAAAHIRRVLETFPGVFTGIGEFSIHKEFVSSKISGDVASLTDPALDSIFSFCEETGLIIILHNDVDDPFPKPNTPNYTDDMLKLFKRHPNASITWAHLGLGRIVKPPVEYGKFFEKILADPELKHVNFDISWDEVAKYLTSTEQAIANTARIINMYPDRFLFGTDNVAPATQEKHLNVYYMYEPIWKLLTPEASYKVRFGNYERLFDDAAKKVRTWEAANVGKPKKAPAPTPVSGVRKE